jgi:aldehyde dehydrogenase (NAD+)
MNFTTELQNLQTYFNSGVTKSYTFRLDQLKKLKTSILQHEAEIYNALYTDLKKSKEEVWVTETGLVIAELNSAIKNLYSWLKPTRCSTNLVNLPGSSYTIPEPYGTVLIIAPWNYPLYLLFNPLIGAIAAGNCVVLKSSEFAPATSAVMQKIITTTFANNYILYTEGNGATVVPALMQSHNFDYVFYTGSTTVGKIIYKMAAENLTPVTLELGGKSPCVIEADANIEMAAKRIAVTKFNNCGQMCVAPDYLLVHESIAATFTKTLAQTITNFFGTDPSTSDSYGKIINQQQFNRLESYLTNGTIIHGGQTNKNQLYIAPTLLNNVTLDSPIMQQEIFGPILPIITFTTKEEALTIIEKNKNPLAFYLFTTSTTNEKYYLQNVAFGGGCINNASWHLTNHHLPFGGRGNSGIGAYHGKYSFTTFSHTKAIMKTASWFNPSIKFPPFTGRLGLFKKLIN